MNNKNQKSDLEELKAFMEEFKKRPPATTPMLITQKEYDSRKEMGLTLEGFAVFEEFVDRNKKHCPQTAAAVRRMKRDDHGSL